MKATLLTTLLAVALSAAASANEMWVYFGTYTRGSDSKGIYRSVLNTETGALSKAQLVGEADNPSFLAVAPDGKHLYAVEETGDFKGEKSGALRSFAISEDGKLSPLSQVATGGGAPCHLVTDSAGRTVYFANYSGGNAGAQRAVDGKLTERAGFAQHEGSSVNERRQKAPHAHSINLDPAGKFAFVADLGIDKIMVYDAADMSPHDPPSASVKPGAGPRHFAFRPDGKFAYVINELQRTVTAFAYDAGKGTLTEIQTLPTAPADAGGSTAHVEVHPSGKFLYGSNRGHDSIVVYSIDAATGKLTHVENEPCGGKTPRNFGIEPGGRFLLSCGQSSGNVAVFRIDQSTGALEPAGVEIEVPKPVCVQFVHPPGGKFEPLFDGASLKGWEGEEKWFRVEDGAIVAGSLDEKIPKNQFLVTEREFGDFELRFKAKLVGQGKNAGVQFWSQRIPDHHEMIGFQCDIGSMRGGSIWGALYDESRRRKFLATVPLPTQAITDQDGGWNEFRIRAEGDAITIWVNGGRAVHYFEAQPAGEIPRKGRFGLQIHSGPPAEAWYKDIEVREL